MNKYDDLSNDELRVYILLEGLEDRVHLTATSIMERLAIANRRYLDQLILNLRSKGYPVVSSKSHFDRGYWVAKDRDELFEYIKAKENYINTHLNTVQAMKRAANDLF